jgi:drug/metabolite transporter (DMT)-like permease
VVARCARSKFRSIPIIFFSTHQRGERKKTHNFNWKNSVPGPIRRFLARSNDSPWLLLSLTALFWAGNVPAARWSVGEISPMTIIVGRWALASLVAFAFLRNVKREEWRALLVHWRWLATLGVTLTISNTLVFHAAAHTTGVNLSILQGVTPALVILGAYFMFNAPIGIVRLIGLAISLLGVAVAATGGAPGDLLNMSLNFGDGLQICASVLYAVYALLLRKRPPGSAWAIFGLVSAASFLTSLPLLAWEVNAGAMFAPSFNGLLALVCIALFTSLLAQMFFMRSVELVGPGRAAIFHNLTPVLGALLSVLLLGETLALYHFTALAMVLGGIFICERFGARG